MSYGVDEDGRFEKKDVADIREDMRRAVQNELGSDKSLRQNSPIQQLIDAFAVEVSRQWDAAEEVYYASFFEDAVGEQLDKQLALAGFSRKPLRPAEGVVVFSRDTPAPRDITIDAGTTVRVPPTETRPQIPFVTTEPRTLFSGDVDSGEVPIEALSPFQFTESPTGDQLGESTNVQTGEITEIVDAVSGIQSVSNPVGTGEFGRDEFQNGRDRETDAEFRLRYKNALATPGVSTPASIESNVFQFDAGIQSVKVSEVHDDADDRYGLNPVVLAPGVGDDLIGQALFESRAAGLQTFGSEIGIAQYEDGQRTSEERFDRADPVNIDVTASLTTSNTYPADGAARIRSNLIQFVGGESADDIFYTGLDIGEDVVFDQLKQRIMEVRGVRAADVSIGEAGTTLGKSDVSVGSLEAARTALSRIEVTV